MIRLLRLSGWVSGAFFLFYGITGLTMAGEMGLNNVIDPQTALILHKGGFWFMASVVALHGGLAFILFAKRHGWIKKKKRS